MNLHEIACVLFPHLQEKENAKKKNEMLKSDGWQFNFPNDCYEKEGLRISRLFIFECSPNELSTHLVILNSMQGARNESTR